MPAILGMGNPLLDMSSEVGTDMLEKYGLKLGDAILAEEKHQPLFKEMAALPSVQYIAGGATQNSIRVAQWMLQEPGATAYMGCVGKDEIADRMTAACKKDGVLCSYMVDESTPTGCCSVLINDNERSLCTNLKAANNYKAEHLKKPENWKILSEAKIVYSAGFFITVSPESIKLASQEAVKTGALYCMNLSAPFICQVPPFKAVLVETMPFIDFLFGNETEAQTWAESENWESKDIPFIATRLSLIPGSKNRKRTVVITQGKDPTIVAINGHVKEYTINPLPKEKLVDTNGAGDAYVGGFLAALSKGLPMEKCCEAGAYSAGIVVQHSGCTYPEKPDYKF
mmetsp:Transcript_92574/g.288048  ORF Transcript_92574/g.288048 Transcript_92574/m.288048 type:complete len:341 (-) Transcript_92574:374-1396(-)